MTTPPINKYADYIIFDVEATGLFPPQGEIPPRMLCAVTHLVRRTGSGQFTELEDCRDWHGDLGNPEPMEKCQVDALVDYLLESRERGALVCGWNTLGYDLRLLHSELLLHGSDDRAARVRELATGHVDPMFNFVMQQGFPVGLQAVCAGMGIDGKTGDGKDVPVTWATGTAEDRAAIVTYCRNDVKATLAAVVAVDAKRKVMWISKRSGKRCERDTEGRHLATVATATTWPFPDNSFMGKTPTERPQMSDFIGWVYA